MKTLGCSNQYGVRAYEDRGVVVGEVCLQSVMKAIGIELQTQRQINSPSDKHSCVVVPKTLGV
jgi:hypothetical protein